MPAVKASGPPCRPQHHFNDPERDSRTWRHPAPPDRRPAPPSGDLRKLGLRVDDTDVCVTFTTAAPLANYSQLSFVTHGPWVKVPGGATVSHGYGIQATLRDGGLAMHYGRQGDGSNQLRGTWRQDGNRLSISMPRSELDRDPTNMPGRPPIPLDEFTFEAKVITPVTNGRQDADSLPQGGPGQTRMIGIVDGRICPTPCSLASNQAP